MAGHLETRAVGEPFKSQRAKVRCALSRPARAHHVRSRRGSEKDQPPTCDRGRLQSGNCGPPTAFARPRSDTEEGSQDQDRVRLTSCCRAGFRQPSITIDVAHRHTAVQRRDRRHYCLTKLLTLLWTLLSSSEPRTAHPGRRRFGQVLIKNMHLIRKTTRPKAVG